MRRKTNNHNKPNNNRRRFRDGGNSGNSGNNGSKIKNLTANRDKYLNMARDAMASGDRIEAESYLQHAEHYFRVLYALQEEDNRFRAEQQQQEVAENDAPEESGNKAEVKEELAEAC